MIKGQIPRQAGSTTDEKNTGPSAERPVSQSWLLLPGSGRFRSFCLSIYVTEFVSRFNKATCGVLSLPRCGIISISGNKRLVKRENNGCYIWLILVYASTASLPQLPPFKTPWIAFGDLCGSLETDSTMVLWIELQYLGVFSWCRSFFRP